MGCRIERLVTGEGLVVLHVSVRIHAEHVDALRELVERERGGVAMDLKEVLLVDREAVKLLAISEAKSTELRNCPAYIREWVVRERTSTRMERSDLRTGAADDIQDV